MATLGSLMSTTEMTVWDAFLTTTADQTASNAQNVDSTQLQFPVAAGETWEFKFVGELSGNHATGDVAVNIVTTGTWVAGASWSRGVHYSNAAALTTRAATAFASTTNQTANPGLTCNNGDGVRRATHLEGVFQANASGTVKIQFSVVALSAGRTATLHKGAELVARKIRVA